MQAIVSFQDLTNDLAFSSGGFNGRGIDVEFGLGEAGKHRPVGPVLRGENVFLLTLDVQNALANGVRHERRGEEMVHLRLDAKGGLGSNV